jgi:mannitol 2-dehydrogenase
MTVAYTERFSNPSIQDTLTRICADTSDRIPKFFLLVAKDRLTVGGRSPMCAAVVAACARYTLRHRQTGQVHRRR